MIHFVGDIHGDIEFMKSIMNQTPDDLVIQVGDFGFSDTYNAFFATGNYNNLKILAGNHDDYSSLRAYSNSLCDYGLIEDFAYLRGALSIDKLRRVSGYDYFENEEIDYQTANDFLSFWETNKPDRFFSHSSSSEGVYSCLTPPFGALSFTERVISEAFKIHEPKLHIHGHLHKSLTYKVGQTTVRSLGINEVFSLNSF